MSKQTVKPQRINYSFFKCPTCQTTGEYTKDNEETYCTKCGTIIETPHRYVAGIRIKTISDFQIQYTNEKIKKRWETKDDRRKLRRKQHNNHKHNHRSNSRDNIR